MQTLFLHDPTTCGPGSLNLADPTACPVPPIPPTPPPQPPAPRAGNAAFGGGGDFRIYDAGEYCWFYRDEDGVEVAVSAAEAVAIASALELAVEVSDNQTGATMFVASLYPGVSVVRVKVHASASQPKASISIDDGEDD